MNGWAFAVLPLAGAFVGALLQSWLSRRAERERHYELLRAEAYADYLKAVAALAHLRSDEEYAAGSRALADAKARIAVYGTESVIKALALFDQVGAILSNPDAQSTFVELVSAMRPKPAKNLIKEIAVALLGPFPQSRTPERLRNRVSSE
jgi:hypothetical protein